MSVWRDMHQRSNGEAVRKEDFEEDLKKKVKAAAKEYVEEYIDAMFDAGCTVKEIQDQYHGVNFEADYIVERMDKDDQDKFWGMDDMWGWVDYAETAAWHYANKLIPALKDNEEEE